MKKILKLIKTWIFGEKNRGFPVGNPKITTVGKQPENFNDWVAHIHKSKK